MTRRRHWWLWIAAVPLLLSAGALTGCRALILTVNTSVDAIDADSGDGICDIGNGSCSLRAAITEADLADLTTIEIAPGINPKLSIPPTGNDDITSGSLNVTKTIFLHGHGATIDGNRLDTVIDHTSGELDADNLTVTNGLFGIQSSGDLHLTNVNIDRNVGIDWNGSPLSGRGGGISVGGASTFTNVNVTNNSNPGFPGMGGSHGAGVSVGATPDKPLVWHGGTISGNSASYESAILGAGAQLDHLTIAHNGFAALSLSSSTITDSYIDGSSNVVFLRVDGVNIVRSTVDRVFYLTDPSCTCNNGPLTFTQSTITGLRGDPSSGRGNIFNVAGPCSASAMDPNPEPPLWIDDNYNLHFSPGCYPDQLGPLANNGESTVSYLPTATSAALDKIPIGTPGLCDDPDATDQRGVSVPQGDACDIGAVERTQ
jgi:CSLREA domain-containing protein